MNVSRRQLIAAAAAWPLLPQSVAAQPKRPVIVELFTSQGCSSCPPADKLFNDLANRADLITLTYHVDYWDYLGWKDTLAKDEFSQRQYDYAHSRGDMDVYTPQAIVQGASHYVGSGASKIEQAISKAAAADGLWVEPTLRIAANEVQVAVPAAPGAPECTVWLASITPSRTVKIDRGENAGGEITYANVVRTLLPAGMWSGEVTTLKLPASSVLSHDCSKCIALVQLGKVGSIVGATSVTVTS